MRDLLHRQHVGDDVGAAALGLGIAHAEEPELAGAGEQLGGESRVGVQGTGLRPHLALGEGAERVAHGLLDVGEAQVH